MICAWTSVLLWRTVPNFPCLTFGGHSIPASREFEVGDRSDQDCVVSQPVRSCAIVSGCVRTADIPACIATDTNICPDSARARAIVDARARHTTANADA